MSGTEDEEFADLFDSSILQSLEGALNDFSLQMKSTEDGGDDLKPVVKEHEEGGDDDDDGDSSMGTNDDDYTYDTYDTGSDDEDEDPATGEDELYAMMDNLVAQLEMEMDSLDGMDKESADEPPVVSEEETSEPPNLENSASPSPKGPRTTTDSTAATEDDKVPLSIDANSSMVSALGSDDGGGGGDVVQDRKNKERAKNLWKVLSGLAQPGDEPKNRYDPEMTPKASNHSSSENGYKILPKDNGGKAKQDNNIQSPVVGDPDYVPMVDYTNLPQPKQEESASLGKPSYVPCKEDFQQLVGILADFSRRKRRVLHRENRLEDLAHQDVPDLPTTPSETKFDKVALPVQQDPDYVPVSDYSPVRNDTTIPEDTVGAAEVVQELELPDTDELTHTDGSREKTGRAIASFTLKKRREYMQRKSLQQQKEGGSSTTETPVKNAATKVSVSTPDDKTQNQNTNGGRSSQDDTTPSRAAPTPSSNKKKRRKRTNKHRKGKPKKIPGSTPSKVPPPLTSQPLHPHPRIHVRTRSQFQRRETREEIIRALAETEIWHWLIHQARVVPK
eukprot:scaffold23646_cov132-Cylindrotheca_fusiformis.AAC.2